jgi:predicted dehydrogenase
VKKRFRGAIVGYGFISSSGHLPAYQGREDVEIVAVADICEARRNLAKEILPGARIYPDYKSLIQNESLDFVDISTPPSHHEEIAAVALEKGIHVLCEKPLTTSLQAAYRLIDLAQRNQRVLFPCHNYKHAPVVKAIGDVIRTGKIGEIRSVSLNTYRNTHAKGVPQWEPHWRRHRKWSGGGIAMDHGSHSFYLAFDWMKSYPTAVTAKVNCLGKDLPGFNFDTEDDFSCTLTFPTGVAHVYLSWAAGMRKVIYTLHGERGAIRVEDDEIQVYVMKKANKEDVAQGAVDWDVERKTISSLWMDASHTTWFNSLFDEFLVAVEKNQYVGQQIQEAVRCVEVIETAYRSAELKSRELSTGVFEISKSKGTGMGRKFVHKLAAIRALSKLS